jgi:hypothetical protein
MGRQFVLGYLNSESMEKSYIQNQKAHHKKETFLNEYKRFLKAYEIEYEEQYIFKEPE